ncbi:MAG: hypothetical protein EA398_07020 [Deltaproteobacteria bacterium]|nr:MAG: hypothetical protein EA398_07020 [Deltaproteobacteria bacterium]
MPRSAAILLAALIALLGSAGVALILLGLLATGDDADSPDFRSEPGTSAGAAPEPPGPHDSGERIPEPEPAPALGATPEPTATDAEADAPDTDVRPPPAEPASASPNPGADQSAPTILGTLDSGPSAELEAIFRDARPIGAADESEGVATGGPGIDPSDAHPTREAAERGTPEHGRDAPREAVVLPMPAEVRGALAAGHVDRALRQHRRELVHCWEMSLGAGARVEGGSLGLSLLVAETGHVASARVAPASWAAPGLAGCIQMRARRWVLPAPASGVANVEATLVFRTR